MHSPSPLLAVKATGVLAMVCEAKGSGEEIELWRKELPSLNFIFALRWPLTNHSPPQCAHTDSRLQNCLKSYLMAQDCFS